MQIPGFRKIPIVAAACLLGACTVGPVYRTPTPQVASQFQAPLPAPSTSAGDAADLKNWWAQFDDTLVAELVAAAQEGNPTIAQSLARITQARANVGTAASALWPVLNADANVTRNSQSLSPPAPPVLYTTSTRSLDASWELDLFGLARKGSEAASARMEGRVADWQVARISLAAEVATTLVNYRACIATATMLSQDLASREQTGQLTKLKIKAGFTPPADGALIDASNADARQHLIAQRASCDLNVKALVALTGLAEPALRDKLAASGMLPRPRGIVVEAVPAQTLAQRPDIVSAERMLAAASADIGAAEADRYPHISLLGSIGISGLRYGGGGSNSNTWSFGPSLTLPLFDGGQRRAAVDAAQGRYDEAEATYRLQVRTAVREVEEALVNLDSAARREADAASAARDYAQYFQANDDKFKAGSGSLFELEDARRSMLTAQQTLIGVQRDRVTAWIALYKALGGGWKPSNINA